MGVGRACDRAVGQLAVTPARRFVLVLLAVVGLAGCKAAGEITGLVAGGVAGGASVNPAVGYAVGVGTAVAADYAFRYVARVRQNGEQDAIAASAGPLTEGQTASWYIRHDIPVGNEGGWVQVVREIDTPLARCREVLFSIHDDPPAPEAWFTTTICRNGPRWKWAQAEPAVERWGFLQ